MSNFYTGVLFALCLLVLVDGAQAGWFAVTGDFVALCIAIVLTVFTFLACMGKLSRRLEDTRFGVRAPKFKTKFNVDKRAVDDDAAGDLQDVADETYEAL